MYCMMIEALCGTFSPGLLDFISVCAEMVDDRLRSGFSWTAAAPPTQPDHVRALREDARGGPSGGEGASPWGGGLAAGDRPSRPRSEEPEAAWCAVGLAGGCLCRSGGLARVGGRAGCLPLPVLCLSRVPRTDTCSALTRGTKTNLKICFPAGETLRFHGFRASYNPRNPDGSWIHRASTLYITGGPPRTTHWGLRWARETRKKRKRPTFLQQNPLLRCMYM